MLPPLSSVNFFFLLSCVFFSHTHTELKVNEEKMPNIRRKFMWGKKFESTRNSSINHFVSGEISCVCFLLPLEYYMNEKLKTIPRHLLLHVPAYLFISNLNSFSPSTSFHTHTHTHLMNNQKFICAYFPSTTHKFLFCFLR